MKILNLKNKNYKIFKNRIKNKIYSIYKTSKKFMKKTIRVIKKMWSTFRTFMIRNVRSYPKARILSNP